MLQTSQQARDLYAKHIGTSYNVITKKGLEKLKRCIKDELSLHNRHSILQMQASSTKAKFDEDGNLLYAELKVRSSYFTPREAITFNQDGFIGFAGWASEENKKPFLKAFEKWLRGILIKQKAPREYKALYKGVA